ncbi:MAG: HD domain-containing protein [Firmicutes bacterium]|nr:HD domain-containing protein [Bacillota bacterium]MDI6706735.1 HDIG domain-containing protein [Bacillota bacterium]
MKKAIKYKRMLVKLPFYKTLTGNRSQRISIALVVYFAILVLLLSSSMPERYSLKAGDVAPFDITAPKDIVDKVETQKRIDKARESVKTTYTRDHTIPVEVKKRIETFFEMVFEVRQDQELTDEQRVDKIKEDSFIKLEDKDVMTTLNASDEELNTLKQNIAEVTNQIMSVGVTPDALERSRKEAQDFFEKTETKQALKELGYNISVSVIRPNLLPNTEETNKDIDRAIGQVEPVIIKKGQNIVAKGERLTEAHMELLKASGLLKESFIDIRMLAGYGLLLFILGLLTAFYLKYFHRPIYKNKGNLMLLGLIIILILFICMGASIISMYMVPVSAISMLITILLDARAAIMINIPVSILVGLIVGNETAVLVMALVGGVVGSLRMMVSYQRRDLFITGLLVGICNALVIIGLELLSGSSMLGAVKESSWGFLNGVFAAILTIGTLPIWENLFDIITPLKLLELSNPNQPLLKKLLMEAPGTYHHSIIVGNLAEYAAQEIGANSLLARVGAYYHDVGKIKRPYFFNENQISSDNPHDKITPSLSTLIITSHVKDGVEMAVEHKIPGVIRDIISQHHGDSVVAYFYHKAKQGENADKVSIDSFRYEGPKPQTRESAIVMLADSVEAAVRSMPDHSIGKMEGMIRKIIKEKLESGQLDESDLTLKDLDTIANAFLSILSGIFHQRIEYPEIDERMRGGKKDDGFNRKQPGQDTAE